MTLFSKSAITFVSVNILRVLSIVAICLVLSGEIVVMVSDVKGYENNKSVETAAAAASPSASTAARYLVRRELDPTSTSRMTKVTNTAAINAALASATATSGSSATATSSSLQPSSTTCSYYGNTSVPKTTGGILFSTLERIFVCIICLFMLVSEMPPPTQWTQRFWNYAFPPLGETFGTGVLGVIQLFVGCSMLSKSVNDLPQVAGWFMFIVAFLNILFGLAFGLSIKSLRSIFSLPGSSSSGLKVLKLPLASNGAAPAGTAYSSYYVNGEVEPPVPEPSEASGTSSSGSGKTFRGIQIGPPMMQKGGPPVYNQ